MADIALIAKDIRKKIYQIAHWAGGGHMGASFSMADIISVLYFDDVLKYDAANPACEERDKFILSKGHAVILLPENIRLLLMLHTKHNWHGLYSR